MPIPHTLRDSWCYLSVSIFSSLMAGIYIYIVLLTSLILIVRDAEAPLPMSIDACIPLVHFSMEWFILHDMLWTVSCVVCHLSCSFVYSVLPLMKSFFFHVIQLVMTPFFLSESYGGPPFPSFLKKNCSIFHFDRFIIF